MAGNGDGKASHDVAAEIAAVERRMALRRERLKRHAGEAPAAARRKAKPLPIVGLVALAGVGFAVARFARSPRPAGPRYVRRDGALFEPAPGTIYEQGWRDGERERYRTAGRLGKLAAVTGAAVRFGMSPQGRYLWDVLQRRRQRA